MSSLVYSPCLRILHRIAQMICKASRIGLSTQPNKIDQLQRHKKFKELSQLYPLPQTLGTLRSKDADGEDNVKKQ